MIIQSARQSTIQNLINQTLIDFFEVSIEKAHNVDEHYETLWKNLYDLHKSGGKRIRPKIVLMSYEAFGGSDYATIAPIACAHELLHFSMLIHDDIIDRDTMRYGVDNISGRYQKLYAKVLSDKSDQSHYANSAALIAGDLMLAGAQRLINESNLSSDQKVALQRIMYDSIFDVAGGQLLDTESSFRPLGSIDALKIAHFKTASYSFVGPFLTGASLAGANKKDTETLRDLAMNLGIAYQLTDDLLGIFGDEAETGKSNTGDIREGKRTYLIERTVKLLSPAQLQIFETYFGKQNATEADIKSIKELIVNSGAKHETEKLISLYTKRAEKSLDTLHIPDESRTQFAELIGSTTKRNF
ncbi:MAG: crtE [Candidatus Saccharibacteria bacterium]|nr:crtE [Candidatus Saccharibacteria bacterium]